MLLLWLWMALSTWAHSTLFLSPFDQTKLESFFAMVVYLVGGYRARHLTWKWVYCNNVFVLLAKHFHEWWKGVIGKLGWMCVMSLLNHILCVWNMWAPIKRPTRQRGLSVVSTLSYAWELRAVVMKDFSGKLQSYIKGNAFNIAKSRCVAFHFCLCYISVISFWPTDSH